MKNQEFLVIVYEEGMDRVEMPSLKEQRMKAKKEAPVSKVHEKKNFKGINESQEVAVNIVRSSLKKQSEDLKERVQQRRLQLFKRRQNGYQGRGNANQTLNISGEHLDSPNMSRSKSPFFCLNWYLFLVSPNDTTQQSRIEDDSVMLQVAGGGEQSFVVDDGHSILKNLDSEINNEDMPSGDEEEAEDDPEMLAELERRQEDLIEEFMGQTFDLKTEKVEATRAACKAEGLSREDSKAKLSEVEKQIVQVRRQGTKKLKKEFAEITCDEEMSLQQKLDYFSSEANLAQIRITMNALLQF